MSSLAEAALNVGKGDSISVPFTSFPNPEELMHFGETMESILSSSLGAEYFGNYIMNQGAGGGLEPRKSEASYQLFLFCLDVRCLLKFIKDYQSGGLTKVLPPMLPCTECVDRFCALPIHF